MLNLKKMSQNNSNQSNTGLLTYIAAIGVGTLMLHISQQLDPNVKAKPWLILLSPTVTIICAALLKWAFSEWNSYLNEKKYKNKKEKLKKTIDDALANQHYSQAHIDQLKELMFELEKGDIQKQHAMLDQINMS